VFCNHHYLPTSHTYMVFANTNSVYRILCRYRLCLVGTNGIGAAEFTLFGRVARQVVGKPVISLIRSTTKNQHGNSGAEFDHMVPELAAEDHMWFEDRWMFASWCDE
jgi:hypothetical protein